MNQKVMALDPGGTTGITIGKIDADKLRFLARQERLTHTQLWRVLDGESPDFVVCETFKFRKRAREGLELISAELIGVVKHYTELQCKPLFMQDPSQAMGYWTDKRLKENAAYIPGKPHAVDAIRHLLRWWKFGYGSQFGKEFLLVDRL